MSLQYFPFKNLKNLRKNTQIFRKFWNFKLWNTAKYSIFNFFQISFFLNHYYNLYFHLKFSDCQNLASFHLISEKPQKTPNSRKNRENLENGPWENFLDHEFGISDKFLVRNCFQMFWDVMSTKNCSLVLCTVCR